MKSKILVLILLWGINKAWAYTPGLGDEPLVIENASGANLTKDWKGNLVISWVAGGEEGQSRVMFVTSLDKGKTFSRAVAVPNTEGVTISHGECPPKLVFKKDGSLVVAFRVNEPTESNPYGGNIYMVQTSDGGKTWSAKKPILADVTRSRGFFDMALLPNGQVGIIWLEGKEPHDHSHEGSVLRFAHSDDENQFVSPVMVSKSVCQCCKTRLYIAKGQIHIVFRKIFENGVRDIAYVGSVDNGHTFSLPQNISQDQWVVSGCPHAGPDVTWAKGNLHLVWFSKRGLFRKQIRENGQLSGVRIPVAEGKRAAQAQMSTLPDGRVVLVWNEMRTSAASSSFHIGIQVLHPDGKTSTRYLSPGSESERPLMMPIEQDQVLLVYTQSAGQEYPSKLICRVTSIHKLTD